MRNNNGIQGNQVAPQTPAPAAAPASPQAGPAGLDVPKTTMEPQGNEGPEEERAHQPNPNWA